MKIGFDLRRIEDTGIGRFSRNLLRAMIAADKTHKFTVVVSSPGDVETLAIDSEAIHFVCAPAPRYSIKELTSMHRIASREGLALIHIPHQFHFPLFAKWATVVTIHDLSQIQFPTSRKARRFGRPFSCFLKLMCTRVDAIMTVSEASRASIVKHLGVPMEQLSIVSNAVDGVFTPEHDIAVRERYRCRMQLPAVNIVYVGMLKPHKNVMTLLRAFAIYTQKYGGHGVNLVIVGQAEPEERRHLGQLARALNIHDAIRFTGPLPDAELRLMYNLADLLVHPSLNEGFGLTSLEAMACGTPVVASDIPTHREVVGHAALLVAPLDALAMADAMAAVLQDQALATQLRRRGFENVKRYAWHHAAQQALRTYRMAYQHHLRRTGKTC